MNTVIYWQWGMVIVSSVVLFFLSPFAKSAEEFFKAEHRKKSPGTLTLTGSLIISWIFAKSITNAADLGSSFGLVGGLAYATYYLSFAVAGVVIYQMRRQGRYTSIYHFLRSNFGRGAIVVFSLLIGFRLFNEVWSNTIVIGSYFGERGSLPYYASILIFTALTLAYSLKGGLKSSIFTDVIQMGLFGILLYIILQAIFTTGDTAPAQLFTSGNWTMATGLNLLFAAFLQSFSYPFHDPVLTDRGFISDPHITLKSFLLASVFGGIFITLFSLVGVYAQQRGLEGEAAVAVGRSLGVVMLLAINFIMITSAASTLDSTFSSFSKLVSVDLKLGNTITLGRITMAAIAVLGTIPVFLNPTVLSATTISGTMVIGLTPVFLFWKVRAPIISFYLSVAAGIIIGILLALGIYPDSLILSEGNYADLLWLNLWGILLCMLLFFVPKWIIKA